LNVCAPHNFHWKPPLRQAAGSLSERQQSAVEDYVKIRELEVRQTKAAVAVQIDANKNFFLPQCRLFFKFQFIFYIFAFYFYCQ
jgi:hypothetical protein